MPPKLSRHEYRKLRATPAHPKWRPRDAISADLADELSELLAEASTELYNNPLFARLRKMFERVQGADLIP